MRGASRGSDRRMVDPLFVHVTKRLREIAHAFNIHSKYLQERHDITIPQVICLREVHEHGPVTLKELTQIVALNNSTVSGIVDRLERRELLTRLRSDRDRRQIHLQITEKGVRFLTEIPPPVPARFVEAVQRLPQKDVDRIIWAVDTLAAILADESGRESS